MTADTAAIDRRVEVPGHARGGLGGDRHRAGHHRLVHPTEVEEREGGSLAFDMGSAPG